MLAKNSQPKKIWRYFIEIERAKDKILAADANLERSMAIYQGTEKMLIPYI